MIRKSRIKLTFITHPYKPHTQTHVFYLYLQQPKEKKKENNNIVYI